MSRRVSTVLAVAVALFMVFAVGEVAYADLGPRTSNEIEGEVDVDVADPTVDFAEDPMTVGELGTWSNFTILDNLTDEWLEANFPEEADDLGFKLTISVDSTYGLHGDEKEQLNPAYPFFAFTAENTDAVSASNEFILYFTASRDGYDAEEDDAITDGVVKDRYSDGQEHTLGLLRDVIFAADNVPETWTYEISLIAVELEESDEAESDILLVEDFGIGDEFTLTLEDATENIDMSWDEDAMNNGFVELDDEVAKFEVGIEEKFQAAVGAELQNDIHAVDRTLFIVEVRDEDGNLVNKDTLSTTSDGEDLGYVGDQEGFGDIEGTWYWGPFSGFMFEEDSTTVFDVTFHKGGTFYVNIFSVRRPE